MADTAIFDVDGTLVDTNYQHALAWYRAFRRFDVVLPIWRIHPGRSAWAAISSSPPSPATTSRKTTARPCATRGPKSSSRSSAR